MIKRLYQWPSRFFKEGGKEGGREDLTNKQTTNVDFKSEILIEDIKGQINK